MDFIGRKCFMLNLIVALLAAPTSFAQETINFSGHLQDSQFKNLNGRECSLILIPTEAQGDQTIAYRASPRIKGINLVFNKRKAPSKTMNVNDLQAARDVYSAGKKNILVGQGSKYPHESSQRLYVNFNNFGEVISWNYRDGTETLYGFTYSCE